MSERERMMATIPDWLLDYPVEARGEYIELQRRYADDLMELRQQLHDDMQTVLQILIDNLSIEIGTYSRERYSGPWIKHV